VSTPNARAASPPPTLVDASRPASRARSIDARAVDDDPERRRSRARALGRARRAAFRERARDWCARGGSRADDDDVARGRRSSVVARAQIVRDVVDDDDGEGSGRDGRDERDGEREAARRVQGKETHR
jgi:hypothetical protein